MDGCSHLLHEAHVVVLEQEHRRETNCNDSCIMAAASSRDKANVRWREPCDVAQENKQEGVIRSKDEDPDEYGGRSQHDDSLLHKPEELASPTESKLLHNTKDNARYTALVRTPDQLERCTASRSNQRSPAELHRGELHRTP